MLVKFLLQWWFAVLHGQLLPVFPVVVQGSKTKGWHLAELAAAGFARACLVASELPVHWVTAAQEAERTTDSVEIVL